MAYLFNVSDSSEVFEVSEFFSLGSDQTCHVQLAGANVAERHCRIEKRGEDFILRDLRSRFGTKVNGNFVSELPLREGDEISISDQTFCFSSTPPHRGGLNLSSKNPAWSEQLRLLSLASSTNLPVLLLGPSGSGKEIIANQLHSCGPRRSGPFLSVNCSALSESLIESELFGHVRGSFTGATNNRKGAFEAARGGTLFLDEIGDLPFDLQAKLLRALENNEIRPVGSDKSLKTDIRIIAATHPNLVQKIKLGKFRCDLYYRLNVVKVNIPSLSERSEDFCDLLSEFCRQFKVKFKPEAIELLKQHSWPGNIRELKNFVARASAYFPRSTITENQIKQLIESDVELALALDDSASIGLERESFKNLKETSGLPLIKLMEKQIIAQRLLANGGNQRKTAQDLRMAKSTLFDRIRQYDIEIPNSK